MVILPHTCVLCLGFICGVLFLSSCKDNPNEDCLNNLKEVESQTQSDFERSCYNDLAIALSRLDAGVDLNTPLENGRYPLTCAIYLKSPKLVTMLLEMGADPNKGSLYGSSLLCDCIVLGSSAQGMSDVSIQTFDAKCLQMIEILCKHGLNINAKYQGGTPALFEVLNTGSYDVFSFLLGQGFDVNMTDTFGNTVLHYLSALGRIDLFEPILKQGANVNIKNDAGLTPAFILAKNDAWDGIKKLEDSGIRWDTLNNEGDNLLIYATKNSAITILEELLKRNINPDHVNNLGQTAAICASIRNDVDVLRILIDANVSLKILDKTQRGIISYAMENKSIEIITLLKKKKLFPHIIGTDE